MRCPFCGTEDTQVRDSRPSEDNMSVRRRRFCNHCNSRFTTFERAELKELFIIKRNGEKRPFERDKITRSISTALRKRSISDEKVEMIVNELVHQFESLGDDEIPTSVIGEAIMKKLSKIDEVAYVRFASVYKDFNNVSDFEKFIHEQLGTEAQ